MKKQVIALMGLMITGAHSLMDGVQREYLAIPLIICKEYDQVYDARGNIKDPMWYMPFEERLLTGTLPKDYQKIFTKEEKSRKITTLVGRPAGVSAKEMLTYEEGVPTIQFSHQFVTTRVSPNILKTMEEQGRIPGGHTGSAVQVCRVYYVMMPMTNVYERASIQKLPGGEAQTAVLETQKATIEESTSKTEEGESVKKPGIIILTELKGAKDIAEKLISDMIGKLPAGDSDKISRITEKEEQYVYSFVYNDKPIQAKILVYRTLMNSEYSLKIQVAFKNTESKKEYSVSHFIPLQEKSNTLSTDAQNELSEWINIVLVNALESVL